MNTVEDLHKGYRRFRAGTYQSQASLYKTLGEGQDPDVLLIGCADSRADPSDIFAAAPGQLFVVRNVANLVPPYELGDDLDGVSAAIEYAVNFLKVKHIVIMGHASCGGVGASLSKAETGQDIGQFITPWVKLLDKARDAVLAANPADKQNALEYAGITSSIDNLMTFPFVKAAVEAGDLELHGAWFAIGDGELRWRNSGTGEFETVPAS